jgi:hypothetical protein
MSTNTDQPLYNIPLYYSSQPYDNTRVENPLFASTNYPLYSIVTEDFHNDVTYPIYKEYNNDNTEVIEKVVNERDMFPFYMAYCCFVVLSFTFGLYVILSNK